MDINEINELKVMKEMLKVEKRKVQDKRFNAYKMEHSGKGYKAAINELFEDENLFDVDKAFGKIL